MHVIVVREETLEAMCGGANAVEFAVRDDGDVYSLVQERGLSLTVPGTVHTSLYEDHSVSSVGKSDDKVRVIIQGMANNRKSKGYINCNSTWQEVRLETVCVKNNIFSRSVGLIETDVLAQKKVIIVGLGSGGSLIADELAKAGVTDFFLIDYDRLEIGNPCRHTSGVSDHGRFKDKYMAEKILEKNPSAHVETFQAKVSWENSHKVRKIIQGCDLAICATDNRPSRLILNRLCVEESKTLIMAGVFRRAYGGQVYRIQPLKSPCYQCYLTQFPEQSSDEQISSSEQAAGLAYTDRPVPIEPGLSTDIAPISLMVVKLAIQELIRGSITTLSSLDDDLIAPWYIWLNRREIGTQYQDLEPLGFNINGFHILRWYGIQVDRHPACPVCGDFESYAVNTITHED